MANWREDIERAREEARKAREEADRLRRDARELERKLRHETRLNARRGPGQWNFGPNPGPGPGPGFRPGPGPGIHSDASDVKSEETFSLEGITGLSVDQGAGRLTIRPCEAGETPGVSSASRTPPKVEVHRDGDRLFINVPTAKGWVFRRRTGATTVVRISGELASIRANLGYGDLQVRDVRAGQIRLDTGAGTTTTFSTAGTLLVNVGAGKLSITAHDGLASARTGTGDVQLDVARVVEGEYRVDVGIGRVEVRLPQGASVALDTSSGIGKTNISFPNAAPGSATTLKASTGIGELTVKARSPEAAAPPQGTPKPQRPGMAPNRHETEELRILQMLEQGKISSQDAADLIAALRGAGDISGSSNGDDGEA